jgi:uncharacterized protein YkwD
MRPARAQSLFIAAVAATAAFIPAPAAHAAPASCPKADVLPSNMTAKQARVATLCLINAERRRHGLQRLRYNHRLRVAGTRHVRDMVRARYFSHDSRSGRAFDTRIGRTGYARGHRASVGENLAWGSGSSATPRSIVRNWMNSPGHRSNILQPMFREVGVAVVRGTPRGLDGATYATEFGRRF